MCVERHLAGGMDCYDFLAGEARYKTSLGETGPEIFTYVLERPTARNRIKRMLRGLRDSTKP
jgi:CelD/BcsL family acetyltransferase involved in cellulose biosynthesis